MRNLANLKAARLVLMDLKHELRSMDHSRLVVDGILSDSIEVQVWTNRVFQAQLDELEVQLSDKGVLRPDEASKMRTISNFELPRLKTRKCWINTVKVPCTY